MALRKHKPLKKIDKCITVENVELIFDAGAGQHEVEALTLQLIDSINDIIKKEFKYHLPQLYVTKKTMKITVSPIKEESNES